MSKLADAGATSSFNIGAFTRNHTVYVRVKWKDDLGLFGAADDVDFIIEANSAPNDPTVTHPTHGAALTNMWLTATADDNGDPDSDTVSHAYFQLEKVGGAVLSSGWIAKGGGQFSWILTSRLDHGSTYYLRVKVKDNPSAGTSKESGYTQITFTTSASNTAPTTPTVVAPTDGTVVATKTPAITVGNSTDANGDTLTYGFELYERDTETPPNYNSTSPTQWTSPYLAEGASTTSWTPTALTENKWVYVRARAYDGQSANQYSGWAVWHFYVNSVNDPPNAAVINIPTLGQSYASTTTQVGVTVQNATDPDLWITAGDLTAFYCWDYDSGMAQCPVSGSGGNWMSQVANTGSTTSFNIGSFTRDHTVYLRVKWQDDLGLFGPADDVNFVIEANSAPNDPIITNPNNGAVLTNMWLTATAVDDGDPDSDTVSHAYFELEKVGGSTINSGWIASTKVSPTFSWPLPSRLDHNSFYYLRVKVKDDPDAGSSLESGYTQIFFTTSASNSPPTDPAIVSPSNGSEVSVNTPTITITNSTDANGDPIKYQFELYYMPVDAASPPNYDTTAPNQTSIWVAETQPNTAWTASAIPENTKVYARVRAWDSQGANEYSQWVSWYFWINTLNDPPTVPQITYPTNSQVFPTSTTQVTMTVTNAADADIAISGSTLNLRSCWSAVSYAACDESSYGGWTSTAQDPSGQTDILLQSFTRGQTIYVKVLAEDEHNSAGNYDSVSFIIAQNTAPNAPTIDYPTAGTGWSDMWPTVRVSDNGDPDSDPIGDVYIDLALDGAFLNIVESSGWISSTKASDYSWAVSNRLNHNTIYHLRARVRDVPAAPNGASTLNSDWTAIWFSTTSNNEAPTDPVVLAPVDGITVITHTPILTVQNSTDPNNDQLSYEFEIFYDDPTYSGSADQSTSLVEGGGGVTSWVTASIPEDTWVYARVRATDGQSSNQYSQWVTWHFFVSASNGSPTTPTIISPSEGQQVNFRQPTIVAGNSTDPEADTLVYVFQISMNSGFTNLFVTSSDIAQGAGSTTSWVVSPQLAWGGSYWVRVKAKDDTDGESGWSASVHFTVKANEPPTTPTFASPYQSDCTDHIETVLRPLFSLNNSTDPEGEALFYKFSVLDYDNPNSVIWTTLVPESTPGPITSVQPNGDLTENAHYRIRIWAYDGTDYSTNFSECSFYVNTGNDLPTQVVITDPADDDDFPSTTTNVDVTIQNATDADLHITGGALTLYYCWSLQSDYSDCNADMTQWDSQSQTNPGPTVINIGAFTRGQRIYMKVAARDDQGGFGSSDSVFFDIAGNGAPNAPTVLYPTAGAGWQVMILTAVGEPNGDPDNDPVNQGLFQLDTDSGFTKKAVKAVDYESSWITKAYDADLDKDVFKWTVPARLLHGQTYYIRAKVRDTPSSGSQLESAWSSVIQFSTTASNAAPSDPTINSPSDGSIVASDTPELIINNSTDVNGDSLQYDYELFYRDTETPPNWAGDTPDQSTTETEDAGPTTTWVSGALPENKWVYARVRADDSQASNRYSGWVTWHFFVDTDNQSPSVPVITDPTVGATVNVRQPDITVSNSSDPESDTVTYLFQVAEDSAFTIGVIASPAVTEGATSTSWTVSSQLDWGGGYYVRAKAKDDRGGDSGWTTAVNFSVKANVPPSVPTYASPYNTNCDNNYEETTLTPTFNINNSSDTEGEDLFYDFKVTTYADPGTVIWTAHVAENASRVSGTAAQCTVPLTENERYRVFVRADDGTDTSDWNECNFWVNVNNDAPTQVSITSPDANHIFPPLTTQVTITVQNATDADIHISGSTLNIRYCWSLLSDYSDCGAVSTWDVIAQDPSGSTDIVLQTFSRGNDVYVKALAEDEYGLGGAAGTLYFEISPNSAPEAPTIVYPTGGAGWNDMWLIARATPNSDPENDPVEEAYFQLGKDYAFTNIVEQSTWIPLTSRSVGQFVWELQNRLEHGQLYHIRAKVRDNPATSRSRTSIVKMESDWTVVTFSTTAVNEAPTDPSVVAPIDGSTVTVATPELNVNNSTDANGDPLSYEFEIFYDDASYSGSADQSATQSEDGDGTTAWTPTAIPENTMVYARVRANDGQASNQYSNWVSWSFFVDVANDAPVPPTIASPTAEQEVGIRQPTIVANNTTDPEDDTMVYVFQLASDAAFNTVVATSSDVTEGAGSTTSWQVSPQLDWSGSYWVRAKAKDDRNGDSGYGASVHFTVKDNEAPSIPDFDAPYDTDCDGHVETTDVPVFTVLNSTDPENEALYYDFKVVEYDAPNTEIWSSLSVPEGSSARFDPQNTTSAQCTTPLTENKRYIIKVRAYDGEVYSTDWNECNFWVNQTNDPPTQAVITAPADDEDFGPLTTQVTLSVENATDPDIEISGSTIMLNYCWSLLSDLSDCSGGRASWAQIAQDPSGQTDILIEFGGLLRGERVYAKIIPEDEYDLEGPADTVFFDILANSKPNAPLLTYPTAGAGWSIMWLTAVAEPNGDPESDPVLAALFQLATAADFAPGNMVEESAWIDLDAGEFDWELTNRLLQNQVYFIRVKVRDTPPVSGAAMESDWTTISFETSLNNDPPSDPTIVAPIDGSIVPTTTPSVTVGNSTDANGDTLTYGFELYERDTETPPNYNSTAPDQKTDPYLTEGSGTTTWNPTALKEDKWIYVRARASDGQAANQYSGWVTWHFYVNAANNPPSQAVIDVPTSGQSYVSTTTEVTVTVQNATDPDLWVTGGDLLVFHCWDYDPGMTQCPASGLGGNWNSQLADAGNTSSFNIGNFTRDHTVYLLVKWQDDFDLFGPADDVDFIIEANSAPNDPTITHPGNGDELTNMWLTATAIDNGDPDPDPVSHAYFELEKDGGTTINSGWVTKTKAVTQFQWTLPSRLDHGSTYYLRVKVRDDPIAGSPMESGFSQITFTTSSSNESPSTPTVVAPADGTVVATNTPDVTVGNSTDANGDTLTYGFELYERDTETPPNYNSTAPDQKTDPYLTEGSGTTTWNPTALKEDKWIYVRARASDGQAANQYSGWVTWHFYVNAANNPPSQAVIDVPTSGQSYVSTTTEVTVTVQNATDPDLWVTGGDLLVFHCWDYDPGMTQCPASGLGGNWNSQLADAGNTSSFNIGNFTRDHTVYLLVKWQDDLDLFGSADDVDFIIEANSAPEDPTITHPGNGDVLTNMWLTATAADNGDPDPDPVSHAFFELEKDGGATIDSGWVTKTKADTQFQWTLPSRLEHGSTYYLRAKVRDDPIAGTAMESGFTQIEFTTSSSNEAPTTPTAIAPTDGTVVATQTPDITVGNSMDANGDTLTYGFELYERDTETPPNYASVSPDQWTDPYLAEGSGTTTWNPSALTEDKWIYVRARASDGQAANQYSGWVTWHFYVNAANNPPSQAIIDVPTSGQSYASTTTQVEVTVQNATDPDLWITGGDLLVYHCWDYDPGMTQCPVSGVGGNWNSQLADDGNTTAFNIGSFTRDHTVYLLVKWQDDFDLFGPADDVDFIIEANSAPEDPTITYPGNGDVLTNMWLTATAADNGDPDPDPVSHAFFELEKDGGATIDSGWVTKTKADTQFQWTLPSRLEHGSTYYLRAKVRDDPIAGTAMESGFTQIEFTTSGANEAPTEPGIVAPPNASEVNVDTPEISITNGTDANGDPLQYQFELYYMPFLADTPPDYDAVTADQTSPWVAEAQPNTLWTTAAIPENTKVYARVRAWDGQAANQYSQWVTWFFWVNTANDPPSAPVIISPTEGQSFGPLVTEVTMTVQNATDADLHAGGVLNLRYCWSLQSEFSDCPGIINSWDVVPQDPSGETEILLQTFSRDQTIYVKVMAQDEIGDTGAFDTVSFDIEANTKPNAPTFSVPTPGPGWQIMWLTVEAQPAGDPEDDPVEEAFFELATDPQFGNMVETSTWIPFQNGKFEWELSNRLQQGQTYFLRGRVRDNPPVFGASLDSDWTTISFSTTAENEAPSEPVVIAPEDGEILSTKGPTIIVENSTDANQDPLQYEFELYYDHDDYQANPDQKVTISEDPSGQTLWPVATLIPENTHVFARVRANDGNTSNQYSAWVEWAFWINTVNDAPSQPQIAYPANADTFEPDVTEVTMLVDNASDPDVQITEGVISLRYCPSLQFNFLDCGSPETWQSIVQDPSGQTEIGLANLQRGTRVFVRVYAEDDLGLMGPPDSIYFDIKANRAPYAPTIDYPEAAPGLEIMWITILGTDNGDPDSDPVQEAFFVLAEDPEFYRIVEVSGWVLKQQTRDQAEYSWPLPSRLMHNQDYYLRMKVRDMPAGGGGLESEWTLLEFSTSFENEPPTEPVVVAPEDQSTIPIHDPTLIVINSTDLNLDPIEYQFEIFYDDPLYGESDRGVPDQIGIIPDDPSGQSSWTVVDPIPENTMVYARVRADDGYVINQYSEWVTWNFFVDEANDPPLDPVLLIPVDDEEFTVRQPDLVVENTTDPEYDNITFVFQVGFDEAFSQKFESPEVPLDDGGDSTAWMVDVLLDWSGEYWARVMAKDDRGGDSGWSPVVHFTIKPNDPPSTPTFAAPYDDPGECSDHIENTLRPSFTVNHAVDPDGENMFYSFQVVEYDDTNAELWSIQVPESEPGDTTSVQMDEDLVENGHYRIRVWAYDGTDYSEQFNECSFYVNTYNDEPSVALISIPQNADSYPSTTANIDVSVANATDADIHMTGGSIKIHYCFSFSQTFDDCDADMNNWPSRLQIEPYPTTFNIGPFSRGDRVYVQVAAIDDVGDFGAVDSVYFDIELNSAPEPPIVIFPAEGPGMPMTNLIVLAQANGDPDNDAVNEAAFELADDANFANIIASEPWLTALYDPDLGTDVFTWVVPFRLNHDTGYWLRAKVKDAPVYRSSMESDWTVVQFTTTLENEAPSEPNPIAPDNGSYVDTEAPDVVIENSTDPNGDVLIYEFRLYYDDPSYTEPADQVAIVAEDPSGQTTWVPDALVENSWNYVQVRAFDGQAVNAYSAWVRWNFFIDVVNDPPSVPVVLSPTQDAVLVTRYPAIEVKNSVDPEGDEISYVYQVSDDEEFINIVAESGLVSSNNNEGSTWWQIETNLLWDTQYHARVKAFDNRGGEGEWSLVRDFRTKVNDPPSKPLFDQPYDDPDTCQNNVETTLRPTFTVFASSDPEGEPLSYEFSVTDAEDTQIVAWSAMVPGEDNQTISATVDLDLVENAHYRIRVRSFDGTDYSAYNECYFWVNAVNDPPSMAEILTPADGEEFPSTTVQVQSTIDNASDPDIAITESDLTLLYCFGLDSNLPNCASDGSNWNSIVQDLSGVTEITLGDFSRDQTAYLKVMAQDEYGLNGPVDSIHFIIQGNSAPEGPIIHVPLAGAGWEFMYLTAVGEPNGDPDEDTVEEGRFELARDDAFSDVVEQSAAWIPVAYDADMDLTVFQWNVTERLEHDTNYFIRAKVRDNPDAGASMESVWTVLAFTTSESNTPPSEPLVRAPEDGSAVNTLTPDITIENATDINLDSLKYEFELFYGDETYSAPPDQNATVAENPIGLTSWIPADLVDNTWIYARVRANDSQDENNVSQWVEWRFFVNLSNDPPIPPTIIQPEEDEVEPTRTPLLVLENTTDPEDNAVEYVFEVSGDESFNERITVSPRVTEDPAGTTSWTVDVKLAWGTFFYARAKAVDEFQAHSAFGNVRRFRITDNQPPEVPEFDSPYDAQCEDHIVTESLRPSFTLINAVDPEGEDMFYEFSVAPFDDPDNAVWSSLEPEDTQAGTSSSQVDVDLEENGHYIIAIRSFDGTDYSEWSECSFYVNTVNDAPSALTIIAPEDQDAFPSDTISVDATVENADDPDAGFTNGFIDVYYCWSTDADPNSCDQRAGGWQYGGTQDDSGTVDFTFGQFERGMTVNLLVAARDNLGLYGPSSGITIFIEENSGPFAPVIIQPTAGPGWTVPLLTSIASPNGDPDGDPLAECYFELSDDAEFGNLLADSGWVESVFDEESQSDRYTWESETRMSYNQTYYLRARVRDNPLEGEQMEGEWAVVEFTMDEGNTAPNPPVILQPLQDEMLVVDLMAVATGNGDINEDPIDAIAFEISLSSEFDEVQSSGWISDFDEQGQVNWAYRPLELNSVYYLRAKARDEIWLDESEWTTISFNTRTDNAPTDAPAWITPPSEVGEVFRSFPVEISWTTVTDPDEDAFIYVIEISRDSSFPELEKVIIQREGGQDPQVEPSLSLTWTADDFPLSPDAKWYMRVFTTDIVGANSESDLTWLIMNENNRLPELESVVITPPRPFVDEDLTATVEASDPDSDPIEVTFEWSVDRGEGFEPYVQERGQFTNVLAAEHTKVGERFKVSVTISDGEGQVGPIDSEPVMIFARCDDDNVCTADNWDGAGCSYDKLPDGTICELDDEDGRCFDGECISASSGMFCENPLEVSLGQLVETELLADSKDLDFECLDEAFVGNDAFFKFAYGAGRTYRITAQPGGDFDLMLMLVDNCTDEATCIGQADVQAEGFPEEMIMVTQEDAGEWIIIVSGDVGEGSQDITLLIQQACSSDGDCNDDVTCSSDTCVDGYCEYEVNDSLCWDELWCNGEEICVPNLGCMPGRPPLDCDDSIACTTDSCEEESFSCIHIGNDQLCDNNLDCDGAETCRPGEGCVPGEPVDCSDGVACTVDVCEENGGQSCDSTPDDLLCEDLNDCTADSCDALLGCLNDALEDGTECRPPVPGRDGVCDGGVCVATGCESDEDCNDLVFCTVDNCDTESGRCVNAPRDYLCIDVDQCNGDESCRVGMLGSGGCEEGVPVDCGDTIACSIDYCNHATGECSNVPDSTVCDDRLFCNGIETCDLHQGCQPGIQKDCSDQHRCTTNICREMGDRAQCVVETFDSLCVDENTCTTEYCDFLQGCVVDNNDLYCDDLTLCNGREVCSEGVCTEGTQLDCDDQNECTIDSCESDSGCSTEKVEDWTNCGDGDTKGACFDGECQDIVEGDNCNFTIELEIDVNQVADFRGAHLLVEEPSCLEDEDLEADLIFNIDLPNSRSSYKVQLEPAGDFSDLDLAIAIWVNGCPIEEGAECIGGANEGAVGELEEIGGIEGGQTIHIQAIALFSGVVPDERVLIRVSLEEKVDGDMEQDGDLDVAEEDFETDGDTDGDMDIDESEINGDIDFELDADYDVEIEDLDYVAEGCEDCSSTTTNGEVAGVLLMLMLVAMLRRRSRRR